MSWTSGAVLYSVIQNLQQLIIQIQPKLCFCIFMYRYHCLWKLRHLFSFCCVRILYLILSQCSVTCVVSFPQFPLRYYYFSSVYLSIISDWEMVVLVIPSAFIIHTEESYNSKKMTHIPGRCSLVYRPRQNNTPLPSSFFFSVASLSIFSYLIVLAFGFFTWRSWIWFCPSFCHQVDWLMCGYFSVISFRPDLFL